MGGTRYLVSSLDCSCRGGCAVPILLAVLCLVILGYFVPVFFMLHFSYDRGGADLSLELRMLGGLIHRSHRLIAPRDLSGPVLKVQEHSMAGMDNHHEEQAHTSPSGLWSKIREINERLKKCGFGGMLLTYFLPRRVLPWVHVAGWLERKIRFIKIFWSTRIGLGDAAATAMFVGVGWGVKGILLSLAEQNYGLPGKGTKIEVIADYQQAGFATHLDCIFKLRIGHIIRATLLGYIHRKWQRSVSTHDERSSDRRPDENGDAEHQRDG